MGNINLDDLVKKNAARKTARNGQVENRLLEIIDNFQIRRNQGLKI